MAYCGQAPADVRFAYGSQLTDNYNGGWYAYMAPNNLNQQNWYFGK